MSPRESGADLAEGVALPFRPQELTVRQLLASHVAVLYELLRRGVVRTRNSPLGNLAETIALHDDGEAYLHTFVFVSQKHPRYSGEAVAKMRQAVKTYDLQAIWRAHGTSRSSSPRPACTEADCAGA